MYVQVPQPTAPVKSRSGWPPAAATGFRSPPGLLLVAAGLALGATTDLASGYGLLAGWLALVGLGVGLALAPGTDAVLAVLPLERSGAGTALAYALRQTGGTLGVALLGSLLAQGYTDRVAVAGLPAVPAQAARDSIAGALAVAARLGATRCWRPAPGRPTCTS